MCVVLLHQQQQQQHQTKWKKKKKKKIPNNFQPKNPTIRDPIQKKEATFSSSSSDFPPPLVKFFPSVAVKREEKKQKSKKTKNKTFSSFDFFLSFSTRAAAHGDYYSWPCFVSSIQVIFSFFLSLSCWLF